MTRASGFGADVARALVTAAFPAVFGLACAAAAPVPRPAIEKTLAPAVATVAPRSLRLADLLSQPPELEVTLHPQAILRDRVYGPLLRRASALAAAYAGPKTLGTTALAALERTEEVLVATTPGDTVFLLRGVPADIDVTAIVDENGGPVWRDAVGDVRQSFVEYEPRNGGEASLFVLASRTWLITAGLARAKTRETLVQAPGGVTFGDRAGEGGLADLSIRGSALVERQESLRSGSLSAIGRSLQKASFELKPGTEGVIVARLDYADDAAAKGAEETTREVIGAFRRKLETLEKSGKDRSAAPPALSWLAAAGAERDHASVSVRAPIPKAWLRAIAEADISSAPPVTDAGRPANGEGVATPSSSDIPWNLWHRAAPAQALSIPR